MKTHLLAVAIMSISTPSVSDVIVQFDEGAPKDRFTITNSGTCPLTDATLLIDLGASAAGLIFDVTELGAGVSVFQPLELVAGRDFLSDIPQVRDGDNRLELPITSLTPGQSIAFTIDVDDTAGTAATMVSGAEIQGARVLLGAGPSPVEAVFLDNAVAQVVYDSCSA